MINETPGKRVRQKRSGFTMIELAIAMAILMIGLVSASAATMRMHHLRKQNRERIVAQNAARSIAERVHAQSYGLSSDPSNWAENLCAVFSFNGVIGDSFPVKLLTPSDSEKAMPGTIQIVTDESVTDEDLGVELGMPRDLNGDGDETDTDVSSDARLLPVIIRIEWRGQGGAQNLVHGFYVMGY